MRQVFNAEYQTDEKFHNKIEFQFNLFKFDLFQEIKIQEFVAPQKSSVTDRPKVDFSQVKVPKHFVTSAIVCQGVHQ